MSLNHCHVKAGCVVMVGLLGDSSTYCPKYTELQNDLLGEYNWKVEPKWVIAL